MAEQATIYLYHSNSLFDEDKLSLIDLYFARIIINALGFLGSKIINPKRKCSRLKDFELFLEMQQNNAPIVFVVNEFGAVEGLITYEDIAEEIVGEIQTRDHPEEILIKKTNDKKYILDGSLDVDYLRKKFRISIEKKGFSTVAGFVTYKLSKIPKKGDNVILDGYLLSVHEATDRSVEKVLLEITGKSRKKK